MDVDLAYLVEYWKENREELASHGGVRDFNRRLQREWVIETGLIERIYTLDRGTTEILLERGLRENLIAASATNRDPALDDMSAIFQSRIDRIDLASGSLIAIGRHAALLEAFVGEGLAIENTETEGAYPQMMVWRLGFNEMR